MHTRHGLIATLGFVLLTILYMVAGPESTAHAQTPAAGPIQPWGLPPLPQGEHQLVAPP